jgi:hypothetical protein
MPKKRRKKGGEREKEMEAKKCNFIKKKAGFEMSILWGVMKPGYGWGIIMSFENSMLLYTTR